MSPPIAHLSPESLPLSLEAASLALWVGVVVLLVVTYDLYRHRWGGGG